MSPKKRLKDVYCGDNPFKLPKSIVRQLEEISGQGESSLNNPERIRYLWVHMSENGSPGHVDSEESAPRRLTLDEWLSVVDEAATLGADTAVISIGKGLRAHPECLEICSWAHIAHNMSVGIHVHGEALTDSELEELTRLDGKRTFLFVDSELMDAMGRARELGLEVYPADGGGNGHAGSCCEYPGAMTCVRADGSMFACGLVLGDSQYELGHCLERRLDNVMADRTLPHSVSLTCDNAGRKCNGCPALVEQLVRRNGANNAQRTFS